jgi:hypothetical protein
LLPVYGARNRQSLTDDERIVMEAARPIPPRDRDQFLRDVAAELAKYSELGPGIIGRVTAKLQRQHLAPRAFRNGVTKWR